MPRKNVYTTLVGNLEKKLSRMDNGEPLPSEQVLADEFEVCKTTMRRALAELASNGLIRKINGVGSVVTGNVRIIPRELIFLCQDMVFFSESLNSFSSYALEANYLSSIIPLFGDAGTRKRIVSTALQRNPAGIVLYAGSEKQDSAIYQPLIESGIPVVYLVRMLDGVDGNLVTFENRDGIMAVIERFYSQGCRRFALYADESVNPLAASERYLGFLSGLKKQRLVPRDEWICRTSETQNDFLEAFRNPGQGPDAIICLNDSCAGNLIRKFQAAKIDISGLKMSGFDHSPMTVFLPHPLLTVAPPMRELGVSAAQVLIRQVENPGFGFIKQKLSSELIEINNG